MSINPWTRVFHSVFLLDDFHSVLIGRQDFRRCEVGIFLVRNRAVVPFGEIVRCTHPDCGAVDLSFSENSRSGIPRGFDRIDLGRGKQATNGVTVTGQRFSISQLRNRHLSRFSLTCFRLKRRTRWPTPPTATLWVWAGKLKLERTECFGLNCRFRSIAIAPESWRVPEDELETGYNG